MLTSGCQVIDSFLCIYRGHLYYSKYIIASEKAPFEAFNLGLISNALIILYAYVCLYIIGDFSFRVTLSVNTFAFDYFITIVQRMWDEL